MNRHPWLLLPSLCLAFCASTQAKELGRLFFTPEQRRLLEAGQLSGGEAGDGAASVLVVNGIVQKHGGKRTVWVNGVPRAAGDSNERAPATTPVRVPGRRKPVELKVGQKLRLDAPAPPDSAR